MDFKGRAKVEPYSRVFGSLYLVANFTFSSDVLRAPEPSRYDNQEP